MRRKRWFMWVWPVTIMLSAFAAGFVTVVSPGTMLRPAFIMWFLFVCPGMTVVRFFRLGEAVIEWTLALALSFAIDAFVAGILLYAGGWSPPGILSILIVFCSIGAFIQLVQIYLDSAGFIIKRMLVVPSKKPKDL